MTDFTRIISISSLLCLSFPCFLAFFFCARYKNARHTLTLIEFLTGFLLVSDALAYFFRGNTSTAGYYMVRLANFFVFACNFSIPFFICVYVCTLITKTHLKPSFILNPKASIKNGIPFQVFLVFVLCLSGILLLIASQFANIFYSFDENNLYKRDVLYPLSVALGLLPGLITLTMLIHHRKKLARGDFLSLLIYFILPFIGFFFMLLVYGLPWLDISFGLGSLHLFFSFIKTELESFSGEKNASSESPLYKTEEFSVSQRKRVAKNLFYQVLSASLFGILLILVVVSAKGISLPEKTLTIEEPYAQNDTSKSVCVTFVQNAEKHWVDGDDPDRTGAQYDGVIFNNMKTTTITDWSFSILVPEGCSVDPGAWNGTFTLSDGRLNVKKPHKDDAENIHGEDFYAVTNLKSLGFGCIMYAPHSYEPLRQKIVFTYTSEVKPFKNVFFDIFVSVLLILFIISTTIMIFEGRLIRVEEENEKLENTVKERTKELEAEKNRSESLLLNILPQEIARELKAHPDRTIAKAYPNATVLFTDIVGFTKMSSRMTAQNVVKMLNLLVSRFDERAKRMGIEKIKTIGDAYMAACGLAENPDGSEAAKMIQFAKGLLEDVAAFNARFHTNIQIRVGVNTGNLVAGVIGKSKFIYDIWGDTVNVASRMESTGEPMKIHVSEATYEQTKNAVSYGGAEVVAVKGKGDMKTYFVER